MAKWVELAAAFDWTGPNARSMVAFGPGVHFMTDEQAAQAISAGAGKEVAPPADKKVTKAGKVVPK